MSSTRSGVTSLSLQTSIWSATCSGGLRDEVCSSRSYNETTQPWLHMPWIRIQMVIISHYYQGQIWSGYAKKSSSRAMTLLSLQLPEKLFLRQLNEFFSLEEIYDHEVTFPEATRTVSIIGITCLRKDLQEWIVICFWFVAAEVEDRGFWLPSVCHIPIPVVLLKINVMLNIICHFTERN